MPPRQNPPPPGSQRRRPGPVMPNSWIWLVILATVVVAMTALPLGSSNTIEWSEFDWLLRNQKVSKLVFKDSDHIVGEVKPDKLADDAVKAHLKDKDRGRFSTYIPPGGDKELNTQL